MPDQYVFLALQRLELAKRDRRPLFAEVDLVSSHAPWTRIPRLIAWNDVGDGSIFKRIPAGAGDARPRSSATTERVRAAYGQSIEYTMSALVSFVQHYGDENLVLVVLGDHQPAKIVSGESPTSRRADLDHRPRPGGARPDRRLGLAGRPAARARTAPVWRMDAFRDRFLSAFGS